MCCNPEAYTVYSTSRWQDYSMDVLHGVPYKGVTLKFSIRVSWDESDFDQNIT